MATRAYEGEEGETRWHSFLILVPFELDYDFRCWMACVKQVSETVEEHELDNWKRQHTESKE